MLLQVLPALIVLQHSRNTYKNTYFLGEIEGVIIYGDIMVSVILKKLPAEIRKNLAREQASTEWTVDELMTAILKEIRVLGSGYQLTDLHAPSRSTAAFYVGSKNNPGSHTGSKESIVCTFCKGPHPSRRSQTTQHKLT